jgi:hypothetical protein
MRYWYILEEEILHYCRENGIPYINYFYHEKIRRP